MKEYLPEYEGGKCPLGYIFIQSHTDKHGRYYKEYCKKIPTKRIEPLANKLNQLMTRYEECQESRYQDEIVDAYFSGHGELEREVPP